MTTGLEVGVGQRLPAHIIIQMYMIHTFSCRAVLGEAIQLLLTLRPPPPFQVTQKRSERKKKTNPLDSS